MLSFAAMKRSSPPLARFLSPALSAGIALFLVAMPGWAVGQEKKTETTKIPFIEGRPFAEVLKKARAEKKAVMLDVYAVWCGPCKQMDRTTFSDEATAAWAKKNVVPAKFDAEKGEGRKVAQRYRVTSFPTVLFMDGNGNEIDRLLGAHPPQSFRGHAENILAGKGGVAEAIHSLEKEWNDEKAASIYQALAQRNDINRLRPLVKRMLQQDSDLSRPGTLDALVSLAALEDMTEKVTSDTQDLVATFLPQLGADSRRGLLAWILAREHVRGGNWNAARNIINDAFKVLGDDPAKNQYASELFSTLATVEKRAGRMKEAGAAGQKAVAAAERAGKAVNYVALRQLELAETLALSGQAAEAQGFLKKTSAALANDPLLLTRAVKVSLALKSPADAVTSARKAVELTGGEDATAQVALALSLAASGDQKGAQAAVRRATELEPDSLEVKRELQPLARQGIKVS
jgi:thiol-disulfide isomerase/thioredoxin